MGTESLTWAKHPEEDGEEQMPQRWETPHCLGNTGFVTGTKQRGKGLERATLWEGPNDED